MPPSPPFPNIPCRELQSPGGDLIAWTGPEFSKGPLPAIFYFSLAAQESLTQDPYNQPVVFLSEENVRIFSLSLPFHGTGYDNKIAVDLWMDALNNGEDVLGSFLNSACACIDFLIDQSVIHPSCLATAGLSRGAFMALQLAAKSPHVKHVLGFAPMTQLRSESPLAKAMDLRHCFEPLLGKSIRLYIGNRDTKVGTNHSFHFVEQLTEFSYQKKIRSPNIEMIISPSIGHQGHGTAPHIFFDGAQWIKKQLAIR